MSDVDVRKALPDRQLEEAVQDGVRWLADGSDPALVLSALVMTTLKRSDYEEQVRNAAQVLSRLAAQYPPAMVLRSLVVKIQGMAPRAVPKGPTTASDVLGDLSALVTPAATPKTPPKKTSPMISMSGRTKRPAGAPDPVELGEQRF